MEVSTQKQYCHCRVVHNIPDDSNDGPQESCDLSANLFHAGETLLYTNSGHTSYVRVEGINLDEDGVLRFRVRTQDDEIVKTTRESLRDRRSPDIGWLPSSVPEKTDATKMMSEEEIKKISNPVKLSPLHEECLALHKRLFHLPFSAMFRLVKIGFLPAKFKKLNNKPPPVCLLNFWSGASSAVAFQAYEE